MNLKFNSLTIKYFGSFIEQTFDFESYLVGLNFLAGRNEYEPQLGANDAGKSTLWNSLSWCLWGKTIDGRRNPDVSPWVHEGQTQVSLTIGQDKITRTISPNRLILNDKAIGQEDLDNWLGINFDIFSHAILLGQGQPLFFDLPPSEMMRIFATALNLERWSTRSESASEQTNELQNEYERTANKISVLDKLLEHLGLTIATAKKKAEEWAKDRKEQKQEQETKLKTYEKQFEEKQKLLDTATLGEEGFATELQALDKEIEQLRTTINSAIAQQNACSVEIDQLTISTTKISKVLVTVTESKVCPTCGQKVERASLKEHVSELKDEFAVKQARILELQKKIAGIDPAIGSEKLKTLQTVRGEFRAKYADAASQITLFTKTCNELKIKIATTKNLIVGLSSGRNIYMEEVRDFMRQQDKALKEREELLETQKSLGRKIERTKFWIKGFKDIQLYIIDEVLQELEFVSNSMLSEIGLEDWQIKYAVEKESQSGSIQSGLHVTILSPSNDKPVRWKCWGGGVAQRLRLVGALALSDVLLSHAGVSTNLEILDEPTTHLSKEGVRGLCPFLAERARNNKKQIWLVDHVSIPSAEFSAVVTVVKNKDQVSMIE